MTFPTALKWEHKQFDTLVWQRTEWCQPIIKGILDGHFLLLSISQKVMTFIHMSCLIFVSCVLFCLVLLSVYTIQLWLWSKRRFFSVFSSTCSLYKLSFPPWCPQLPSTEDCFHKRQCSLWREWPEEEEPGTNNIAFFDHFTTVISHSQCSRLGTICED